MPVYRGEVAPKIEEKLMDKLLYPAFEAELAKEGASKIPQDIRDLYLGIKTIRERLGVIADDVLFKPEKKTIFDIQTNALLRRLEKDRASLPEELVGILDLINDVRQDFENAAVALGRPKGSKGTKKKEDKSVQKNTLGQIFLDTEGDETLRLRYTTIKGVITKIFMREGVPMKGIELRKLDKTFSLKLMFEPFGASGNEVPAIAFMDDELNRKMAAKALCELTEVSPKSAQGFYAHVSSSFRDKDHSSWEKYLLHLRRSTLK